MSLRFYFGPNDEGKSKALYSEIIQRAMENPKQNFLIMVPDQYTMYTQKQLVTMHPRGGIMNIDVLSFGRLGHRVLEEVGNKQVPVLDDTGKSLVLQKVAGSLKDQLPTLGGQLHRQGYIHEVKSVISEFMQYGLSPKDVEEMALFSAKRGALSHKLKDLGVLYTGFTDYIKGNFITTEETLDVLKRSLCKSKLLPGSVVVLDGFTGFTPIQYRLVQEIMSLSEETIVSLTMGEKQDPFTMQGEQELFYLSKKTVADLCKLAKEAMVERTAEGDVYVTEDCLKNKEGALKYLQKNLFRYGMAPYEAAQDEVMIFDATDPKEEVHQMALLLSDLIHEKKLAYRDVAVVVGDLGSYAPYIEAEFSREEIPCFIDQTRGIVLNPMIEFIKSMLNLYIQDFSYNAVFHYLRSGMSDITRSQVDLLDNYALKTGLRGYRNYSRLFIKKNQSKYSTITQEEIEALNATREQLMEQVKVFAKMPRNTAKAYVECMYDFLVQNNVQQKLVDYENFFTKEGDLAKAREYGQIFRLVMELLEQIHGLLGEEEISLQEFADILEAGFGEIEVGTIPQNVDRVLVGDIERTRLQSVKVLFFMGVNDGNIPRNASKGGIISDMDREFLKESDYALAPTPRQQMFIQRFYLYLNMTKPSERLYLSFSRMNSDGKSIRPAYLIDTCKAMYVGLSEFHPQNRSLLEQTVNPREAMDHLAKGLREYAQGTMQKQQEKEFFTLYASYDGQELQPKRESLKNAAFMRYQDSELAKAVALALYGTQLSNSVTRLETFAACAYKHFLEFGLSLEERQEFGFQGVDQGNIYHSILEIFAAKLAENHLSWFDFTEEFALAAIGDAMEHLAAEYGETILYSTARNEYMIGRLKRVLLRTVLTLQKQLQKGEFVPKEYEVSFEKVKDLKSVHFELSDTEKMHLRGRIDRVDVAEDEDHVYVKVIDYKSGNRKFDLAALYYGLQLQLVVYMNTALEMQALEHPDKEVVPAAMLYYHIDDPTVESAVPLTEEQIKTQIMTQLRTKGLVNADMDVVTKLDSAIDKKSDVIPVELKKDGAFSAHSDVMSRENMQIVSDFVNRKIRKIGRDILAGNISLNPYEDGKESACTYCNYKKVCGFDESMPGCEKRNLPLLTADEIMKRMIDE